MRRGKKSRCTHPCVERRCRRARARARGDVRTGSGCRQNGSPACQRRVPRPVVVGRPTSTTLAWHRRQGLTHLGKMRRKGRRENCRIIANDGGVKRVRAQIWSGKRLRGAFWRNCQLKRRRARQTRSNRTAWSKMVGRTHPPFPYRHSLCIKSMRVRMIQSSKLQQRRRARRPNRSETCTMRRCNIERIIEHQRSVSAKEKGRNSARKRQWSTSSLQR